MIVFCVFHLCVSAWGTKQSHILLTRQGQWKKLPARYQKEENLLVLIWFLNWLWVFGIAFLFFSFSFYLFYFSFYLFCLSFYFAFFFPVTVLVYSVCAFVSSHTFFLIPRIEQALALVLNHFQGLSPRYRRLESSFSLSQTNDLLQEWMAYL